MQPEIFNPARPRVPGGEPAVPSASDRLTWRLLSVLAAILPGFGAAYASRSVIEVFHGMAASGGGISSVSMGLYESNRVLILAGIAASVFSAWLALMAARKPERAAALPGRCSPR